jgi:hypothetical protein
VVVISFRGDLGVVSPSVIEEVVFTVLGVSVSTLLSLRRMLNGAVGGGTIVIGVFGRGLVDNDCLGN